MFFKTLREDISAIMDRDPAARSRLEVFLCYPGFHAVVVYRITSWLWKRGLKLLARFISHVGHILTDIEIHPGAQVGNRIVIDHGTGVVIGETSIIGDDVTLYQAVTLGGIMPAIDSQAQANTKRHPTLEDGVIVGSGAQILGPIVIGRGARVGANAVVTRDIPPGVTAAGIPARVIMPRDKNKAKQGEFVAYGTPTEELFDPVLRTIDTLRGQVAVLAERIEELEERLAENSGDAEDKPQKSVNEGKRGVA